MSKIGLASLARGYAQGIPLAALARQAASIDTMSPNTFFELMRERAVRDLIQEEPGVWLVPGRDFDKKQIHMIFDDLHEYINELVPLELINAALAQMLMRRARAPRWSIEEPYLSRHEEEYYRVDGYWRLRPEAHISADEIHLLATPYKCRDERSCRLQALTNLWERLCARGITPTFPQLCAFNWVRHHKYRLAVTSLFNEWSVVSS